MAEAIGERLRAYSEENDITLRAMALKADVPYRSFLNYAKGEQDPGAEPLARIAEGLGVSLDWLVLGRGAASMAQMPSDALDEGGPKRWEGGESIDAKLDELFDGIVTEMRLESGQSQALVRRSALAGRVAEVFYFEGTELTVAELRQRLEPDFGSLETDELHETIQMLCTMRSLEPVVGAGEKRYRHRADGGGWISRVDDLSLAGLIRRCVRVIVRDIAPIALRRGPAVVVKHQIEVSANTGYGLIQKIDEEVLRVANDAPDAEPGAMGDKVTVVLAMAHTNGQ